MTSLKNKLCIDFASNPDWGALFVTAKAGDKLTLEVDFTIDEVDQSELTASIDAARVPELDRENAPDTESPDEDATEPPGADAPDISVNPKAPVFIAMGRDQGGSGKY